MHCDLMKQQTPFVHRLRPAGEIHSGRASKRHSGQQGLAVAVDDQPSQIADVESAGLPNGHDDGPAASLAPASAVRYACVMYMHSRAEFTGTYDCASM